MQRLFEQTFTLVLRIANAILEDRANAGPGAIALRAQGDQVLAGLRLTESRFDARPGTDTLRAVVDARAAYCGQVAGERLLEAYARRGTAGVSRALDGFDRTANALIRYANARSTGDDAAAVAAVEEARALLPPDRRETLSR